MKKQLSLTALAVFAVLTLSGCTSFDFSLDSLLSPPKLTDEQAQIYTALLNSKGSSVELSYPKSGDYRSAFVLVNLDAEPTKEAMVFYKSAGLSDETSLRINFLDQDDNGVWSSIYDLPAIGAEVENVSFHKLSGQTDASILISYSVLNQSDRALSVLRYSDRTVTEVYKSNYIYLDFVDAANDGTDELFLISYDSGLGYPTASLLGWTDVLTFASFSRVPLPADAVSFQSLICCPVSDNETAIYLDYGKGDSNYATELLYCYGTKLSAATFDTGIFSRRINSFTPPLTCADIDGDGAVEIPSTTPFIGYENLTKPEQVCMTVWYSIEERLPIKKISAYYSYRGDYYFKLPSRWLGLVSVTVSGDDVTFYDYKTEETLMTVEMLPVGTGYIGNSVALTKNVGDYDYYVSLFSESNRMSLTADELADCIKFIEDAAPEEPVINLPE